LQPLALDAVRAGLSRLGLTADGTHTAMLQLNAQVGWWRLCGIPHTSRCPSFPVSPRLGALRLPKDLGCTSASVLANFCHLQVVNLSGNRLTGLPRHSAKRTALRAVVLHLWAPLPHRQMRVF
jgi:hypothetical protein